MFVVGGHGYVGSRVVDAATADGADPVVISRTGLPGLNSPSIAWPHFEARLDEQSAPPAVVWLLDGAKHAETDRIGELLAWAPGDTHVALVSTCTVYGDRHGSLCTEQTPLDLVTPHARVKAECERMLADSALNWCLFELLTILLFAAHSVTYKTGYDDLSTVVEDRLSWAAGHSSDPLMGALAAWARTTSMLHTGAYDIGQRLLDRVQVQIAPGGRRDPDALRVSGPLHLRSAMLAARGGDADTATEHLAEARRIAEYLGDDHDGGWHQLSFGPANVAIHVVAASVELGDGGRALAQADNLRLPANMPAIRAGHHYVDLSRAQLWARDHDGALKSLYLARKLAPQQTRHHPTTREVLRMLVRVHRRSNEPLVRLVGWIGGEL